MKAITKAVLTVAFAMFANGLFAADLIVTKESKKIDAKVVEVSPTEVRYKKTSNLDGPTFVLPTSDIHTIVYDNGEVEIFKTDNENAAAQPQAASVEAEETVQPAEPVYSLYDNGDVLGFLSLNGEKISSREYAEYLRTHCQPAYAKFARGQRLWKAGWVLTLSGIAAQIVGMVCVGLSSSDAYVRDTYKNGRYYHYDDNSDALFALGITTTVLGTMAATTGVPFVVCGGVKRGRSIAIYEEECGGRTAFEWGISVKKAGLGLALSF